MISVFFDGLSNVVSFPNIIYAIAGTLIAMVVSFMPGIGMVGVASIFLLISAYWPTEQTLVFFGAIVGGATFMGSVTGILFNIPGSTPSAAILLDGYPLAQNGYPKKALAASATASAIGSIFGVMVLLLILPIVKDYILLIGPFEKVLIAFWGIICVCLVTKSEVSISILMIFLGLIFAAIGLDLATGLPRMTFGIPLLSDGIDPIIFMLGFFSISEIFSWKKNYLKNKVSHIHSVDNDGILSGVISVFQHKWLTIQSSIIGTIVGIIPGIGGTVASLISYSFASNNDKYNEFGKGDIRGVIAPEAAVDAKDGGSLLPAILLGLPGSEIGIILIGVFTIHGLVPGSTMLTSQLSLTYTLILALLFSNLLTSFLGLLLINQFVKLKNLNIKFIAFPTLLITCFIAYDLRGSWVDLVTLFLFGIIGILFTKYNLPKIPFIISFILGKFLESNVLVTAKLADADKVLKNSQSLAIILIVLIFFSLFYLNKKRNKTTVNQNKLSFRTLLFLMIFSVYLIMSLILEASTSSYALFITIGLFASTALVIKVKQAQNKLN